MDVNYISNFIIIIRQIFTQFDFFRFKKTRGFAPQSLIVTSFSDKNRNVIDLSL